MSINLCKNLFKQKSNSPFFFITRCLEILGGSPPTGQKVFIKIISELAGTAARSQKLYLWASRSPFCLFSFYSPCSSILRVSSPEATQIYKALYALTMTAATGRTQLWHVHLIQHNVATVTEYLWRHVQKRHTSLTATASSSAYESHPLCVNLGSILTPVLQPTPENPTLDMKARDSFAVPGEQLPHSNAQHYVISLGKGN